MLSFSASCQQRRLVGKGHYRQSLQPEYETDLHDVMLTARRCVDDAPLPLTYASVQESDNSYRLRHNCLACNKGPLNHVRSMVHTMPVCLPEGEADDAGANFAC